MELSKTKPISYGSLRGFLGQWAEETLEIKEEIIQDAVKRVWNDFNDDDMYEIQFEVKYSEHHYGKHIFELKGCNIPETRDEFDLYDFKYDAEMHCIIVS